MDGLIFSYFETEGERILRRRRLTRTVRGRNMTESDVEERVILLYMLHWCV